MKRLIELGNTQAIIMNKILKEEWQYKPKMAMKFTLEKIDADSMYSNYYLCVNGKLDTTFFGCLMYKLGLEMNIK
jgi:hypothetical protein